jgi:hypothetical protein
MSKLTIEQKIEKAFQSKVAKKIETYNSKDKKFQETLELKNYKYKIDFGNSPAKFLTEKFKNNNKEEQIERNFILNRTRDVSLYLLEDKESRQASFVNNYDGKDNHCLAYFHFYIRDKKLYLNVYVRSQNYDTNFQYDAQTFILACHLMGTIIQHDFSLANTFINVHTMSLHRVVKILKKKNEKNIYHR